MPMPTADREVHRIQLTFLTMLRWAALAVQVVMIGAVHWLIGIELPLLQLLGLTAFSALTNVALTLLLRRGGLWGEPLVAAVLVLDVLVLTALLYVTGGPFNPFSFLYLVYITLATVVLGTRWTWAIAGLSSLCSALLFIEHVWLNDDWQDNADPHVRHMKLHLYGMWVACVVAAVFIVYFVTRIRNSLTQRDAELAQARERVMRGERLASLATLAAGAAHELATPLSTIAVVAKELQSALAEQGVDPEALDDARLIRAEVQRCREILAAMAADLGQSTGEQPSALDVTHLLDEALAPLARLGTVALQPPDAVLRAQVQVPERAMVQALRGVLKNALQAQPPGQPVVVTAQQRDGAVVLDVVDRGPGMGADVLARVGEPFFTTKQAGDGMGLGVFLARAVIESAGGTLQLASVPGRGTTASISLPATIGRVAQTAPASHPDDRE